MNELEEKGVECTHLALQAVAMEVDHGPKQSLAMSGQRPVEASVFLFDKKGFEADEEAKDQPKDLCGPVEGGLDLNVSVGQLNGRVKCGVGQQEP